MTKRERNDLRRLRAMPAGERTPNQIRRLIALAHKDSEERRTHDPIKPQEKRK